MALREVWNWKGLPMKYSRFEIDSIPKSFFTFEIWFIYDESFCPVGTVNKISISITHSSTLLIPRLQCALMHKLKTLKSCTQHHLFRKSSQAVSPSKSFFFWFSKLRGKKIWLFKYLMWGIRKHRGAGIDSEDFKPWASAWQHSQAISLSLSLSIYLSLITLEFTLAISLGRS